MSKSRSARRVLAAAAALPLVLSAAPLTGIAQAAVTIAVAEHPLPTPRVVGPNAGYLEPARGVQGYTPLYRIDVSDPAVGLQSVRIGLSGPTLNVYRDFDGSDGFSLFADIDSDGVFDAPCPDLPPATEGGDPVACPSDFGRGPASDDFTIGAASDNVVPVTISGRVTADPVEEGEEPDPTTKGFRYYFVVLHPAGISMPNRVFTPQLFANGVSTTDGATGPSATRVSEAITLDSLAPPTPSSGNFSNTLQRPPMSDTQTLEDGYFVGSGEYNSERGKRLAFYNSASAVDPNNLLRRPDGAAVIHTAPTLPAELSIGDGTGINPLSTVAKNNQTTNDVFVRGLDAAGNYSTATLLTTDEIDSDRSSSPGPYKGNDVTAPVATSYKVNFQSGTNNVNQANASNAGALPVRVELAGVPGTSNQGEHNVDNNNGRVEVRVGNVDGQNKPTGAFTEWQSNGTRGGTAGGTSYNAAHTVNTTTLSDGRLFAQTRMWDDYGNASLTYDSMCTDPKNPTQCDTLRAIPKDVVVPKIVAVVPALDVDGDSVYEGGDKFKVYFSEIMDKADIVEGTGTGSGSTYAGPSCGPPDDLPDTDDPCVTFRLTPQDGAPTIGEAPEPTTYDEVVWGGEARPAGFNPTTGTYAEPGDGVGGAPIDGPGFQWTDGGSAAIITLAPMTNPTARFPVLGDKVIPVGTTITDRVGNGLTTVVTIIDGGVIPLSATTRDSIARFPAMELPTLQNHDGVLDSIDLVFSAALKATSVSVAAPNFRITGSTGTFTPQVVVPSSDGTSLELRIPLEHRLNGDETPVISLVGDTALATGLLRSSGAAIPPFTLLAGDGAKPTLVDAKTQDANHNGQLDAVGVRYSELVNHANMNERGYVITGYEDNLDTLELEPPANTWSPTTGTGVSQTINLEPKTTPDTGVLPAGKYTTYLTLVEDFTTPDVALRDLAGNTAGWTMPNIPDGAQPVALSAVTRDTDSDGKLDAVDVKFSEALASSSTSNGTFTVDGHEVLGSSTVGSDVIRVRINETGEPFTGDTALVPPVRYTGGRDGGLRDTAGLLAFVPATDAPAITPADGAGPAIVAASVNFEGNRPTAEEGGDVSDKMRVFFSEPVAAVAAGDFLVGQLDSNPTTAGNQTLEPTAPSAATLAADGLTADLTIEPKLHRFLDGYVRFGPDAAVKDKVTPTPNSNTQRDPVVSPAYPIATLLVVGPEGSNPGYSTTRTPIVFAGGNDGVTGYCLQYWHSAEEAQTAPDSVDDECYEGQPEGESFVSAPPTTTRGALPIDGLYTFQLTTRDRFGNVSLPTTKSITVDTIKAAISTLSFKNHSTGSTTSVRDNDFVNVDAVTTGNGASKFTATIDYKGLSRAPGGSRCTGTVCTGQILSTSSTSRSFRFPFITASGTTVYPVGTVLRPSNDPGQPFILEDGPNGQIKRRFLSSQAMSTYRIPTNLVIKVPPAVTNAIPSGARKVYRDGSLVKATGSTAVYVIVEGKKSRVTQAQMEKFGYKFGNVITVPAGDLNLVPAYSGSPFGTGETTHPVGTYVRNTTDNAVYVLVKNSAGAMRKRRIASGAALATLVPSTQVISVPSIHPSLQVITEFAYKRGLRDGMLVRFANERGVFVVSRGGARHISSLTVMSKMGFSFDNVVTVKRSDLGVATTLAPLSTYLVTYTVTVRDVAGNATSRVGSVTALGRPLAAPTYGSNAALP